MTFTVTFNKFVTDASFGIFGDIELGRDKC
jgi:hypothetical protein